MKFPSRDIVERIRKEYPKGSRVELVKMDDLQAPPIGTKGTVRGVDDTASIKFWGSRQARGLLGRGRVAK